MDKPRLNDLAAFAAVARHRSFTRAAAELGVSPSALSHAMRGLEDRVGVRLLARSTRSVAPTEAGERLLAAVEPAIAGIEAGLAGLADWRQAPSGIVRLTTFHWLAGSVLVPRLPEFMRRHPDIEIEVNLDDGLTDIVSSGFDAGIRLGESVEKDMIAVRVGPDLRTVVAATPEYFERHARPETPRDLERHACVCYRLASSGSLLPWEFARDGQEIRIRATGPLVVNGSDLAMAAVRAGVGIGYMMEEDAAEDIAAGRLVQVLDDWCPPYDGAFLYHTSRRQTPPALRALIDFLRWRD